MDIHVNMYIYIRTYICVHMYKNYLCLCLYMHMYTLSINSQKSYHKNSNTLFSNWKKWDNIIIKIYYWVYMWYIYIYIYIYICVCTHVQQLHVLMYMYTCAYYYIDGLKYTKQHDFAYYSTKKYKIETQNIKDIKYEKWYAYDVHMYISSKYMYNMLSICTYVYFLDFKLFFSLFAAILGATWILQLETLACCFMHTKNISSNPEHLNLHLDLYTCTPSI